MFLGALLSVVLAPEAVLCGSFQGKGPLFTKRVLGSGNRVRLHVGN